jgi:hypothetical protein
LFLVSLLPHNLYLFTNDVCGIVDVNNVDSEETMMFFV